MKSFFAGFEKRALVGTAFGAGVGAGGAYATAKKEMEVSKLREATIEKSPSLSAFIKKLQPGDVIYSGSVSGDGGEDIAKKLGLKTIPFLGGNLKYHVMLHTGKGKVVESIRRPEGDKKPDTAEISLSSKFKGMRRGEYTLTAYRPIDADRISSNAAVDKARSLIGGKYPDNKQMFAKAMKTLVGVPGDKSKIDKNDPLVCQDVAIKAYPNKFGKRHLTSAEMQYNQNFIPVAKAGDYGYDSAERILAESAYPVAKAFRAGLQGATVGGVTDILRKALKNKRR